MIKVCIVSKKGEFASLEVKGHAESAPYGKDLVCAAISAITVGGLNALSDDQKKYKVSIDQGHVYLEALEPLSSHDQIVITTIITQIESVAESSKDYVTLERKNEK
jgi:uncharacterized protein YsxB (DUF464 family)